MRNEFPGFLLALSILQLRLACEEVGDLVKIIKLVNITHTIDLVSSDTNMKNGSTIMKYLSGNG